MPTYTPKFCLTALPHLAVDCPALTDFPVSPDLVSFLPGTLFPLAFLPPSAYVLKQELAFASC